MIIFFFFIALLLGISLKSSYISIGIISVLFFCFLLFKRKVNKGIFIYLSVFLFGFGISFIKITYPLDKTQYTGVVYQVKDNYFLFNSKGEKLYCYEKNHDYEIGDIVHIKGYKEDLDFTVLESWFDFNTYLNNKGVYHSLKIDKEEIKLRTIFRFHSLKKKFLAKFTSDTSISVNAILFSDHDDNSLTNAISDLHLARLINAGGLYFHALIGTLNYFIGLKIKKKWAELTSIGIISFYLLAAFPRFSLIRLTFVYLFKWINENLFKKRFNYLEILSISAIFFLLINHHLATQDSFLLGFGIPLLTYFINQSFSFLKGAKKKLFMVFSIYLFFIPFELRYYRSLSPLSSLYQVVLSPLFILFFFMAFLSFHYVPIYKLLNGYNSFLTRIVSPISKLRIEIFNPEFNQVLFLFYYLILFLLLYYASIRFRPIKNALIISLLTFLSIYSLPLKNTISAEVCFVNVGQGDCCFIREKNKTVFIDTGGLQYTDLARNNLIPFLKKKRIYSIDLVITTHDDFDHNGALTSLKNNFRVKTTMTNTNYQQVTIGNITFVNYNNHLFDNAEDNEKSLVIGFHLADHDYLITGDASIEVERAMMKEYSHIPCDILKVGHHGSKTSTSDAFVKWLNPSIGVISVGKNNWYGHPHKEVIQTLKSNGVTIRRTDQEGTITFFSYIPVF